VLNVREQLVEKTEPVNSRNLTMKELLTQSMHYSPSVRKEALSGLFDLVQKHPWVVSEHLSTLLLQTLPLLSDPDEAVRGGLGRLWEGALAQVPSEEVRGVSGVLGVYLEAGVRSIDYGVRLDTWTSLSLWLPLHPLPLASLAPALTPAWLHTLTVPAPSAVVVTVSKLARRLFPPRLGTRTSHVDVQLGLCRLWQLWHSSDSSPTLALLPGLPGAVPGVAESASGEGVEEVLAAMEALLGTWLELAQDPPALAVLAAALRRLCQLLAVRLRQHPNPAPNPAVERRVASVGQSLRVRLAGFPWDSDEAVVLNGHVALVLAAWQALPHSLTHSLTLGPSLLLWLEHVTHSPDRSPTALSELLEALLDTLTLTHSLTPALTHSLLATVWALLPRLSPGHVTQALPNPHPNPNPNPGATAASVVSSATPGPDPNPNPSPHPAALVPRSSHALCTAGSASPALPRTLTPNPTPNPNPDAVADVAGGLAVPGPSITCQSVPGPHPFLCHPPTP
jgi:hypothetical protein